MNTYLLSNHVFLDSYYSADNLDRKRLTTRPYIYTYITVLLKTKHYNVQVKHTAPFFKIRFIIFFFVDMWKTVEHFFIITMNERELLFYITRNLCYINITLLYNIYMYRYIVYNLLLHFGKIVVITTVCGKSFEFI